MQIRSFGDHIRQISVQVLALHSPLPQLTQSPLACVCTRVSSPSSVTEAMRYARTEHSFVVPTFHSSVPNYLLYERSSHPMWSCVEAAQACPHPL